MGDLGGGGGGGGGGTRSCEGRFPSSRSSPLATPCTRITFVSLVTYSHTRCCPPGKAPRNGQFAKGQTPPTRFRLQRRRTARHQSSETKLPHATTKRAQRRGVLGGSVRASQLRARSPLRSSLSFQHEEKIFIQTTKTVLQSSYIKNDNLH